MSLTKYVTDTPLTKVYEYLFLCRDLINSSYLLSNVGESHYVIRPAEMHLIRELE